MSFSIQCPGCQSKLKVKDRSLAGKKLACPKCKTPIVVKLPEEAPAPMPLGDDPLGSLGSSDNLGPLSGGDLDPLGLPASPLGPLDLGGLPTSSPTPGFPAPTLPPTPMRPMAPATSSAKSTAPAAKGKSLLGLPIWAWGAIAGGGALVVILIVVVVVVVLGSSGRSSTTVASGDNTAPPANGAMPTMPMAPPGGPPPTMPTAPPTGPNAMTPPTAGAPGVPPTGQPSTPVAPSSASPPSEEPRDSPFMEAALLELFVSGARKSNPMLSVEEATRQAEEAWDSMIAYNRSSNYYFLRLTESDEKALRNNQMPASAPLRINFTIQAAIDYGQAVPPNQPFMEEFKNGTATPIQAEYLAMSLDRHWGRIRIQQQFPRDQLIALETKRLGRPPTENELQHFSQRQAGSWDPLVIDNLKRVNGGLSRYRVEKGCFPGANRGGNLKNPGPVILSWRVHILEVMGAEEKALYKQFHLDEPWDSPHNIKLLDKMPAMYKTDPTSPTKTAMHFVTSDDSPFADDAIPDIEKIKESIKPLGVVVVSGPEIAIEWTAPGGVMVEPSKFFEVLGTPPLRGGYPVGLADGSVKSVSKYADPTLAHKLFLTSERSPKDGTKAILFPK